MASVNFGVELVESDPPPDSVGTDEFLFLEGADSYDYEFDFSSDPDAVYTIEGTFGPNVAVQLLPDSIYVFDDPEYGTLVSDEDTGEFLYTLELDDLPAGLASGEEVEFDFTVSVDALSLLEPIDTPLGEIDLTGDTDTVNITAIACFAEGTRITTPDGERNVETLTAGDFVTAEDGRAVEVRWIGVKVADPMFNPAERLEPVLIKAGALGENTPSEDLVVTADHGMIVDGHVVDASVLVGAPGIEFVPWKQLRQTITYYHIETAGHEIVYANSAPAETFIDYTGRRMFDNYAEFVALYGEENTIPEMELPRISALRQMPAPLRARFGLTEETITFNTLAA